MNSKNSILLIDPDFDPNTAADCHLLLRITTDSFSYAIIDKKHEEIKVVFDHQECQDIAKVLSEKLKADTYLTLAFKEIKVSVFTENTIAIPTELFEAGNLNQYAKFFTEQQSDDLFIQSDAHYGFTSIFNLNTLINDTLSTALVNCKRFDHTAPALVLAENKDKNALVLDFTVGSFQAVFTRKDKLIFKHYFQIENSEEFNYYLLFIIQQLHVDVQDTEIFISGIIHADDMNYRCITKYFKTILFSLPRVSAADQSILEDMPAHYYSSLLALDSCE